MPYTRDQIGPTEVRPLSTRAKDHYILVLIQHDRAPGHDETQVTVLSPCSWSAGRRRVMEMVARGVDVDDLRVTSFPRDAPAGASDEGLLLHNVEYALWWTVQDDIQSREAGGTAVWAAKCLAR